VQAGERVVITVSGRPVAQLVPLRRSRRVWLERAELIKRLEVAQADAGLRDDLAELPGDTTDDLGPV
jgi:prevent-host-death family protein